MTNTPTISCETFLNLYEICEHDCSKFIKIDSKWNSNKKGNAHYNNNFVKIKGMWVPFNLKVTDEQMAFWIAALNDEDAAKQTTDLGTKKPIIARKASISQKACITIMLYPSRLDIDPKTGELTDPSTLPDESDKSNLVRVLDIYETYRDEIIKQRIDNKSIVDNVREIVPNHSFKVSSKKICPILQRYYGDKSPLAGKKLVNPTVRITLPFSDSGMAPKETYYMNDITPEQNIANKDLKKNKKFYNPVPLTFTNEDCSIEPISDCNVHRIPMRSTVTFGIIKISVCSSSQGISSPLSFYKLVITKGERSKISVAKLYSDSEDEDDEEDAKNKSNTTVSTSASTSVKSEDDEPNLEGLMEEDE